jgi:hypothetical protein
MIKYLFIFGIILSLSSQAFTQEDKLEFAHKKSSGENTVAYFDIQGLEDNEQAEKMLKRLLKDPQIIDGRYFKSSSMTDRYELKFTNNVDANYILSILQEMNLDYDYSSVYKNGVLEKANHPESNASQHGSPRTAIAIEGFPEFIDTGNPEEDEKTYAEKKRQWIEANPEKYQEYLNSLK